MHTYMHTYIHAYIHAYIHTYTWVRTYVHTYIHCVFCVFCAISTPPQSWWGNNVDFSLHCQLSMQYGNMRQLALWNGQCQNAAITQSCCLHFRGGTAVPPHGNHVCTAMLLQANCSPSNIKTGSNYCKGANAMQSYVQVSTIPKGKVEMVMLYAPQHIPPSEGQLQNGQLMEHIMS